MEKIIRFFPLNKGIVKGQIKSLVKPICIYIVSNIILAIVVSILDFIPLVKNLLHHVDNLYELYILAGSILALVQYFTGMDSGQIPFVNKEDLAALWKNQKYRICILVGAVVLCVMPYQFKTAKNTQTVSDNVNKNENTEAMPESTEEITAAQTAETQIEEKEVISEETKAFYEYAKGFWAGADAWYTFEIIQDKYVFYHSGGEHDFFGINSKDAPLSVYETETLTMTESQIEAVLVDVNRETKYDVVLMENATGKKMKIKEQGTEDWILLSNNNATSYEEFLNQETHEMHYMERIWQESGEVWLVSFDMPKEDINYAIVDLSEEMSGEELLIQTGRKLEYTYYAFGIEDGIVKPIYRLYSYQDNEFYDEEEQNFWAYFYGGTSGGHHWYCYQYDEEIDFYKRERVDGDTEEIYTVMTGENFYFAPAGEDYQLALEEAQKKQEEEAETAAKKEAEMTFAYDETNAITEPLESYVGTYANQTFEVEVKNLTEEMCSLTFYYESASGSTGSVGLGSRVESDEIAEGVYAYAVSGIVNKSTGMGSGQETYAVVLALRPDGSIYINNIGGQGATMKLPAGTYYRPNAE